MGQTGTKKGKRGFSEKHVKSPIIHQKEAFLASLNANNPLICLFLQYGKLGYIETT